MVREPVAWSEMKDFYADESRKETLEAPGATGVKKMLDRFDFGEMEEKRSSASFVGDPPVDSENYRFLLKDRAATIQQLVEDKVRKSFGVEIGDPMETITTLSVIHPESGVGFSVIVWKGIPILVISPPERVIESTAGTDFGKFGDRVQHCIWSHGEI